MTRSRMDSETRNALSGMADEVLDVAERLISVGENLNKLAADTETPDNREQWMRGARLTDRKRLAGSGGRRGGQGRQRVRKWSSATTPIADHCGSIRVQPEGVTCLNGDWTPEGEGRHSAGRAGDHAGIHADHRVTRGTEGPEDHEQHGRAPPDTR
jgi:hypothetical protein